jgi:hypothetical protein
MASGSRDLLPFARRALTSAPADALVLSLGRIDAPTPSPESERNLYVPDNLFLSPTAGRGARVSPRSDACYARAPSLLIASAFACFGTSVLSVGALALVTLTPGVRHLFG